MKHRGHLIVFFSIHPGTVLRLQGQGCTQLGLTSSHAPLTWPSPHRPSTAPPLVWKRSSMNFPKREELLFRTVQASEGFISGILEALPEFISDNTVHYLPVLQVAWIFPILTVFQQDQLQNISENVRVISISRNHFQKSSTPYWWSSLGMSSLGYLFSKWTFWRCDAQRAGIRCPGIAKRFQDGVRVEHLKNHIGSRWSLALPPLVIVVTTGSGYPLVN